MSLVSRPWRYDARSWPDTTRKPRSARSKNAAPRRAASYPDTSSARVAVETKMLSSDMVWLHSIRAGMLVLAATLGGGSMNGPGQQVSSTSPASSSFTIFFRAMPVGAEQISLERTSDGWTITGRSQISSPFDLVTRSLRMVYDPEWKPRELAVDLTAGGQVIKMLTTVTGTTAASQVTTNGAPPQKVDMIDEAAVLLLAGPVFAPYEAVAARLRTAAAGARLPVYVVPQGSVAITVGESVQENIQTLGRLISARRSRI